VGIVLAVVAGYLFGVLLGTLLIAVASLMSAWLVFRLARGLLYRRIQRHFKKPIRRLSEEFKENGLYYLMALRLSYMLPFFLVNITLGSLPIRTGTFLITTAAGLLPGTILYVWLGQSLAEVEHLRDLIDLKLAALFILLALLALLPVAYKKLRTHFSAS
jgi:uncharacterized membrane protein YdjX (TVP38/TMEM64 family)